VWIKKLRKSAIHPDFQLMQMSLAVKSPAAAAAVVAQEPVHHSAVLLNCFLHRAECISLGCPFSSHCLPEAAMSLPDKWWWIGVGEYHVEKTSVPTFVLVYAFEVADTGLVKRTIVLGAKGWRAGDC
jgi:hypothetical protein